jgi:LPS export ABC transporter protein LptC
MFFSCKNDIREIKALTDDQEVAVQTTFQAVYDYTENGKIQNRLEVSRLDRFEGENRRIEISEGFTLIFFDSTGIEEARLRANRGIFQEELGIMKAMEDVELRNNKNEQLNTEELIWLQDSGKVYTEEFVKITRADGVIFGRGLTTDETFSSYSLKEISGDIYVKEDSLTTKTP